MKSKVWICVIALFSTAASGVWTGWPVAKITVRVTAENGTPVRGAIVTIGFREKTSSRDAKAIGETDDRGEFTAEGHSDMRLLSGVTKEGYYKSSSSGVVFKDAVNGKWVPWNPVTPVVLRLRKDPVPLHVKQVKVDVPVLNSPCGYDLEMGDWVDPHGKGKSADFIFTVQRDYRDRYNFVVDATVGFSKKGDGIVRMASPSYARNSVFRWERSAPESGYRALHSIRFKNNDPLTGVPPEMSFSWDDRDVGYFFRVRTLEGDGSPVKANYGKISGDITLDPRSSQTCRIYFTYYYNPKPRDRNLEWDVSRNLFAGLGPNEVPRDP